MEVFRVKISSISHYAVHLGCHSVRNLLESFQECLVRAICPEGEDFSRFALGSCRTVQEGCQVHPCTDPKIKFNNVRIPANVTALNRAFSLRKMSVLAVSS
jgi:hypothetical protein